MISASDFNPASIGEIITGLLYLVAASSFLNDAVKADLKKRAYFRLAICFVFAINGLEEIADALYIEGQPGAPVIAQYSLTSLQVFSGVVICWALYRAKRYMRRERK